MFAELAWLSSPSNASFIADIVAVITGETDKNNLSSDIVLGATSIVSVVPAGWEVWDDDTGVADEYILRAPTVDDPTQYKYCRLLITGSTTRTLSSDIMEDWNPGSNTATNQTNARLMTLMRTPVQTYGDTAQIVTVMATARYIIIRQTGYNFFTTFPCIEIDRIHPSLAIGTGRVPAVHLDDVSLTNDNLTTYNVGIPRILDDAGTTDITGTTAPIRVLATHQRPSCVDTNTEFDSLSTDVGYDSGGVPYYGVHLMLFERRDLVAGIIGVSAVSNIWMMQAEVVTGFEDKTTHDLDGIDDVRCMWTKTNLVTSGFYPRFLIKIG